MRVVGFERPGGPEVLQVFERPEPHAGPGEVRIRVHAATVNPADTLHRSGSISPGDRPAPWVPGMEAAGVVDEVGEGTRFVAGDRVFAWVLPIRPDGGGYAEYVVVPAAWVTHAPKGSSHAEAATLPMNGLTAQQALRRLELSPGDTIAVTGAPGALGGYVVQLARADGLRVIADAAPRDEELVRTLGADVVVARGDDVADRILAAEPGGVPGLVDSALIGGPKLARAVRDGGRFATVRLDSEIGATPWTEVGRGVTRVEVWVPDEVGDPAKLDRLRELAEAGTLTMRVAEEFPAGRAADAHRALEAGGRRGRLVLTF